MRECAKLKVYRSCVLLSICYVYILTLPTKSVSNVLSSFIFLISKNAKKITIFLFNVLTNEKYAKQKIVVWENNVQSFGNYIFGSQKILDRTSEKRLKWFFDYSFSLPEHYIMSIILLFYFDAKIKWRLYVFLMLQCLSS